jgi:hypothetical protein
MAAPGDPGFDWASDLTGKITRAIADGFKQAGVAGGAGVALGGAVGGAASGTGKVLGWAAEWMTGAKDLGESMESVGKNAVVLATEFEALKAAGQLMSTEVAGLEGGFVNVGIQARKAAFGFNQATGAGGEFDEQIFQLRESLKEFPVGAEDVVNSVGGLYKGFTDFSLGGLQPTEMRIAETITILGKLGASVDSQVDIVQGLRKVWSQSDMQIDNSLREFEALADTLNMDLGVVMTNFQSQIPLFASFGDNAVSAFKRMQMQSKATGIEMSKLVSISEGFTTIEDSAKVVGQLNQLLGDTGLLPSDLMTAALEDPAKAMDMLQGSLSGFDVDNMNAGMKRALAEILGFGKDIDEFISFARGGSEALEQMDMKKIKTDTELLERVQPATPYNEMADAMANAALSIDGLAAKAKKVDQTIFEDSLTRIKTFREEAEASGEALSQWAEGKGVKLGGFDDFLAQLKNTLDNAIPTGTTIQDLIAEDRTRTEELVRSIKDMQVHVYLDAQGLTSRVAKGIIKG